MKKILILMAALALLVAFSAPAMAEGFSTTLGIRVIPQFKVVNTSEEATNSGKSVTESDVNMAGNSYLRVKFASDDKKVGAQAEVGLNSTVNLRYTYGWYKIGNCTFLAGNSDTWLSRIGAYGIVMDAWGLDGFGTMWEARKPELQLNYESGNIGFQFTLRDVRTVDAVTGLAAAAAAAGVSYDAYYTVPSIGAAFAYTSENFEIVPSFQWVRGAYEGLPSGFDDGYDAYVFHLPLKLSFGGFGLTAGGHIGKNPGGQWETGVGWASAANTGAYLQSNGNFADTDFYGGFLSAAYKVGNIMPAAGVGFQYYQNDEWKKDGGFKEDNGKQVAYFVNVTYTVHKYFIIYPEFAYFDYGDNPVDGKSAGNSWLLGVALRFIF